MNASKHFSIIVVALDHKNIFENMFVYMTASFTSIQQVDQFQIWGSMQKIYKSITK